MTQTLDAPRTSTGSARKAVVVGHLMVTLPVLVMLALGVQIALIGVFGWLGWVGAVVMPWLTWSLLVPRWRDWVADRDLSIDDVQRLAQRTGLVWPQGWLPERTELPRRDGQQGW